MTIPFSYPSRYKIVTKGYTLTQKNLC